MTRDPFWRGADLIFAAAMAGAAAIAIAVDWWPVWIWLALQFGAFMLFVAVWP